MKDTSISIRMDSDLKQQTEQVLEQFGLNMTTVINMLFRQIVREQAIPLTLSLYPPVNPLDELALAEAHRHIGYKGRSIDDIITDMEQIVAEAEEKYAKEKV